MASNLTWCEGQIDIQRQRVKCMTSPTFTLSPEYSFISHSPFVLFAKLDVYPGEKTESANARSGFRASACLPKFIFCRSTDLE